MIRIQRCRTGHARRALAGCAVLALLGASGCGSGARHAAHSPKAPVMIGSGTTAAGNTFRLYASTRSTAETRHQEAGGCPLNVDVSEGAHRVSTTVCYARLESPVEAHVECIAGTLAVHAELQNTTRWVRLNLSNHRQVTSSAIQVPRELGGPSTIYYQALRGPKPIPISLTEVDRDGRDVGTMRVPRVVECTQPLVRNSPHARVLATIPAPGGDTLVVRYQPYRALGTQGYGLTVVTMGRHSRVVGSGALRIAPPLEWEVRRICGSVPYTFIYGVLALGSDHVFVSADGVHGLHTVALPSSIQPHGVFVYGFEKTQPSALIVRKADGSQLIDRNVGPIIAETPCS